MRAVVQRVSQGSVKVDGEVVGEIGPGLLVLLGVAGSDGEADAGYLAEKIAGLRIFEDAEGKMNRSVGEVDGAVLAVSQLRSMAMCDVASGHRLTVQHDRSAPVSSTSALSLRFAGGACAARLGSSRR